MKKYLKMLEYALPVTLYVIEKLAEDWWQQKQIEAAVDAAVEERMNADDKSARES